MGDAVDLLALDEIAPDRGRLVRAAGREIALFRAGGQVFAIDDGCPHASASLAGGHFDGRIVTCRAHGLRFHVATGCMVVNPGLKVRSYPAQVLAGRVCMVIDESESPETPP